MMELIWSKNVVYVYQGNGGHCIADLGGGGHIISGILRVAS